MKTDWKQSIQAIHLWPAADWIFIIHPCSSCILGRSSTVYKGHRQPITRRLLQQTLQTASAPLQLLSDSDATLSMLTGTEAGVIGDLNTEDVGILRNRNVCRPSRASTRAKPLINFDVAGNALLTLLVLAVLDRVIVYCRPGKFCFCVCSLNGCTG